MRKIKKSKKWQWISDQYGPMGVFSDEEKTEHESQYTNGHWHPLSQEEIASFNAYVKQLAYEQS